MQKTTQINNRRYLGNKYRLLPFIRQVVAFADTFFCRDDCRRIGYIREDIENLFVSKQINERERAILITSLLYSMDKIAKTCGHYDAYIQWQDIYSIESI